MASFAEEVADSGVRVMIMGYYGLPEDADYGFDACMTLLPEMSARQTALADGHPMIWFADTAEVVSGNDLTMFDEDQVHPSIEGGAVVGTFLAEQILAAD